MEKKITIGEREFTLVELKYKVIASLGDLSKEQSAKKLMILSTGMSDEEYDNLTLNEGITLQKEINDFNGLSELETDFQKPLSN